MLRAKLILLAFLGFAITFPLTVGDDYTPETEIAFADNGVGGPPPNYGDSTTDTTSTPPSLITDPSVSEISGAQEEQLTESESTESESWSFFDTMLFYVSLLW